MLLGPLGGRGEEEQKLEGVLCREIERERKNQHLATAC